MSAAITAHATISGSGDVIAHAQTAKATAEAWEPTVNVSDRTTTRVAEYHFGVLVDRTEDGGYIVQVRDETRGELHPLGVCEANARDDLVLEVALKLADLLDG